MAYGVRSYTCSEKTKRPKKTAQDLQELEKRNTNQKRLYITLNNIDEIFSQNEKFPVCHDMIFNIIQGKVTKYFNTRNYDRKKEISYDCLNRLYSTLKRKLLQLKQNQGLLNPEPTLFFYLSQFFRYIELVVYSTVHYGTLDQKYLVQEPEDFQTEEVLNDYVEYLTVEDNLDDSIEDNSERIKSCIESNNTLDPKQKQLLLKLYKNSYSLYGDSPLTKRDNEVLQSIQKRLEEDPTLLSDLKEILNG